MTRKHTILLLTLTAAATVAPVAPVQAADRWQGPRLLLTPDQLNAIQAKVASHAWAKALLGDVTAEADKWAARPVEPPTTGGGWHHNYVCPKDAGFLEYREDSPNRHWCPRCEAFYEGDALDATWVNRRHMEFALAAETCAISSRLGGKKEHADWARRVLLWYAEHYASFPINGKWAGRGRVTSQSLDEAMWLIRMAGAFDLVANDMTDADQQTIIEQLFLPAGKHIENYFFGVHNIQCWHAAATMMAGMIGGDTALRDKSIASLRENIAKGITDEGFWFEAAPGYHNFTMMALTPALLVAKHNNIDLGPPDKLREMHRVIGHLALPKGEIPALNDGGSGTLASMAYFLETGCYLFDDPSLRQQLAWIYESKLRDRTNVSLVHKLPNLLYGLADLPDGGQFAFTSKLLKDTGLAVLRHDGNTVIVKSGRQSGGHDHGDRCQLILADAKRTWFSDLGTSGYGHPLYVDWYRHTASHCTVMVDGKPQAINTVGQIAQFETDKLHQLVTVRCDDAYPGVSMTRTVALIDGLILDRFAVSSTDEHDYAFLLHAPGVFKPDIENAGGNPQESAKLQLGSASVPQLAKGLTWLCGSWREEEDTLSLTAAASVPFDVCSGKVPGFPGDADRSALALTSRGRSIVFAAAYVSSNADSASPVEAIVSPTGDVVFKGKDGKEYVLRFTGGKALLESTAGAK